MRQSQNMQLSAYGSARRRYGTQYVNATAAASILRRALYWPTQAVLICTGSSNDAFSVPAAINSSLTTLSGSLGQTYGIDLAIFSDGTNERLYIASSNTTAYITITTTSLQRTDGATVSSALAGVPSPITGLTVYNSRLWGWNVGKSNALYYSNLSTATSSIGGDSLGVGASGGGVILVTTFGAQNIVACLTVGSSLLIFHQRGISRLTGFGQSDIDVMPQAVTADVSIWGRNSVDEYNGTAYVVTALGLFAVTEGAATPVATPDRPDPLPPILAAIGSTDNGNTVFCRVNRATQEVWVQIASVGVYVYNLILGAWSGPYTDTTDWVGMQYMTETVDAHNNPSLWQIGVGSGLTHLAQTNMVGSYFDHVPANFPGGTQITTVLQPHRMFTQQAMRAMAKSWRWANITAALNTLSAAITMTSTAQYGGTSTLTLGNLSSVMQPYYEPIGGMGPWVDLVITDASSGASEYAAIEVQGFLMGMR